MLPLLPPALVEQGILENEDRGEPEESTIGKRKAMEAGVG